MTEPKFEPSILWYHFNYCDAKNSGTCSCDPEEYEELVLKLFSDDE